MACCAIDSLQALTTVLTAMSRRPAPKACCHHVFSRLPLKCACRIAMDMAQLILSPHGIDPRSC